MLYLLAAIIGSSSLVIVLKIFDLKRVNMYLGITLNYLVGGIMAFLFAPMRMSFGQIVCSDWFLIAMLIGVVFMATFVVYGLSAQRSGVAITTISGRAAVVIPVIFAFVALGEQPTWIKVGMLVLILLSMVLILRKKPSAVSNVSVPRVSIWLLMLPLAVFAMNGFSDTMVQYGQRVWLPGEAYIPVFMGTMFAGGTLTGLICYLFSCIKRPHMPNGRDLLWGSILGALNWLCMFGVFNALTTMDGSVFYPLYYTGAIVCSTIVGVWVFKERLSRINYVGIVIAIIAIAVLSTQ